MNWELVKFTSAAVSGCLATLAAQNAFQNRGMDDIEQQAPKDDPSVFSENSTADNTDSADSTKELVRALYVVGCMYP